MPARKRPPTTDLTAALHDVVLERDAWRATAARWRARAKAHHRKLLDAEGVLAVTAGDCKRLERERDAESTKLADLHRTRDSDEQVWRERNDRLAKDLDDERRMHQAADQLLGARTYELLRERAKEFGVDIEAPLARALGLNETRSAALLTQVLTARAGFLAVAEILGIPAHAYSSGEFDRVLNAVVALVRELTPVEIQGLRDRVAVRTEIQAPVDAQKRAQLIRGRPFVIAPDLLVCADDTDDEGPVV